MLADDMSQALADAREVLEGQQVTNSEAQEATTMAADVKAAMSDDLNTPLVVGAVSPVLKVIASASGPSSRSCAVA
jgi:cysteinyl-tRNA synthetase